MVAVILAGGSSRRMGRDKATLPWGNATLLEHQIKRYAAQFDRVLVAVDRAGRYPLMQGEELVDIKPIGGPGAALLGALERANGAPVFLTAVDMPLGDPVLARRMTAACQGRQAVLLAGDQPLFGAYGPLCIPSLQAAVAGGQHRLRELVAGVDWLKFEDSEIDINKIMVNLNTWEEYKRARLGGC